MHEPTPDFPSDNPFRQNASMDQQRYFQDHPPRCVAEFITRTATLEGVDLDGHASLSQLDSEVPDGVIIRGPEQIDTIFQLACPCGCGQFSVHCYLWANPDYGNEEVILSPIEAQCQACQTKRLLIDTDAHGYDAELDHGTTTARGEGERIIYACPQCGNQSLPLCVRFEYTDELFDGGFPEFSGREQDLFTWFSLIGECEKCSQSLNIADFECA